MDLFCYHRYKDGPVYDFVLAYLGLRNERDLVRLDERQRKSVRQALVGVEMQVMSHNGTRTRKRKINEIVWEGASWKFPIKEDGSEYDISLQESSRLVFLYCNLQARNF
jgi:hypothetical protein